MKKVFLYLNTIVFFVTLVTALIYHANGGILLKAFTSFGFLFIGVINLIYAIICKADVFKYPAVITCGLLLSFTGDVLINYNFIIGAILFALGHILYLVAYCLNLRFNKKDFLIGIVLFAISSLTILLCKELVFNSVVMKLVCIVYALVISATLGKAFGNFINSKSLTSFTAAIGTLLFFISDVALLFYMFAGASEIPNTICLFTYVPGQCIIAFSVNAFVNKKGSV